MYRRTKREKSCFLSRGFNLISWIALFSLSWSIVPVCAWYVAAPASKSDWEQMAKLLAQRNKPPNDDKLARIRWIMWGRRQNEENLYRRYVKTARQLQGAKYAVLVAKEWGQLLGVAEMGISTTSKEERRPTLGALCVDPTARRQGIGRALVEKCEAIAAQIWQEDALWIEVETTNHQAYRFFETCGYMDTQEISLVSVQRQQGLVEQTPHCVLRKDLVRGDGNPNGTDCEMSHKHVESKLL